MTQGAMLVKYTVAEEQKNKWRAARRKKPVSAGFKLELAGAERNRRAGQTRHDGIYLFCVGRGLLEVNTHNGVYPAVEPQNESLRPVEFGEALPAGTRLTLFSEDKPDRFCTVIKSWIDETLGASLALRTGVPCYQVEGDEGRIFYLLTYPSMN